MEFASGGNLEDFLLNSPPESWELVIYLAKRITSNLRCIQDIGLLHQDLHPGNIVFDNGTPRIIDVGLSRIIEVEKQSDTVYGRMAYLPPEYFVGGEYTQKSEIYCLGTILWQLVSGVAPRNTAGEIDRQDGMREEMVPGMPAGYEAILRDCWNLDPNKRPTIEEVEQRLGDMEHHIGEYAEFKWGMDVETLDFIGRRQAEAEGAADEKESFEFVNGKTSVCSRLHVRKELEQKVVTRGTLDRVRHLVRSSTI